jgi:histidinol phosphatase-like enzyme (inositol monophosphatase family)
MIAAEMAACLATAHRLADTAGAMVRAAWRETGATRFKTDASPVTETDTAIEERLRAIIAHCHPAHGVLGEEFGADGLGRSHVWVVDPIDGTRQFAARLGNFGVLVALCRDGVPVLGVIDQPLAAARVWAVEGGGAWFDGHPVRCASTVQLAEATAALANPNSLPTGPGSAFDTLRRAARMVVFDSGCLAYAALARGAVDLCLNGADLDPYDICALVPVVREAGGVIGAWDGRTLDLHYAGPILAAASRPLFQTVADLLDMQPVSR